MVEQNIFFFSSYSSSPRTGVCLVRLRKKNGKRAEKGSLSINPIINNEEVRSLS